jgi:ribosome-binding factor A
MNSVIEGLTRVKSFIRREIAKKVSLRHTPDLRFLEDNTFKEVDHINELLKRPEVLKDLRKK